ncbi:MAG: HD domain-containing phosphohydrolase [Butyrivibrio sp.]
MGNELIINRKELVDALINNTPIAYIIMDDLNRIHFVNDSFLKLRGLERDKTVGEVCYNISNGGNHCQYCAISQAMENGCKTMLQRKDILPNGMVRYIDDYAIPLYQDKQTGLTYLLEIMVNRSEEMQILEQCNRDLEDLIKTLVLILAAKDSYTAKHCQNVQRYATKIARGLNLSETEVFHISIASLLHDIGKLQIPLNILNKPKELTDDEYSLIKSHPVKACEILDDLVDLDDIRQMVRHHHERIDGKGYPDGLCGQMLDLGSRILAVADTYDAMTTDRSYRKAISREDAISELKRVTGTQLDYDIVTAFTSIPEEKLTEEEITQAKHSLVVRELKNDSVNDVHNELVTALEEIEHNLDNDELLNIIFDNTPCGYVLVDENSVVKFVNNFVLSLFGYKHEEFTDICCDLFSLDENDLVRTDCIRMQRNVPSGECIFDLYQTELSDASGTYVMYVIINRTEEAKMHSKLRRGYLRLVNILQDLLNTDLIDADTVSHQKIMEIKDKVELLTARYEF